MATNRDENDRVEHPVFERESVRATWPDRVAVVAVRAAIACVIETFSAAVASVRSSCSMLGLAALPGTHLALQFRSCARRVAGTISASLFPLIAFNAFVSRSALISSDLVFTVAVLLPLGVAPGRRAGAEGS